MAYVDGYLIPVRRDRKESYTAFSARVAAIYREHGALLVVACWMDGVTQGKRDLPRRRRARGAGRGYGGDPRHQDARGRWAGRGRRAVLDRVAEQGDAGRRLARVLADPRLQRGENDEVILEGRRLVNGGFAMILDA